MLTTMLPAGMSCTQVGVYAAKTNNYNIGAFMEKAMTMRAGQTPVQRYWHQLFQMVRDGILKPQMVITHELPLEKAPQGYKIFNEKQDGVVKVHSAHILVYIFRRCAYRS